MGKGSLYITVKNPNWYFMVVNLKLHTNYIICNLSRDIVDEPISVWVRGDGKPEKSSFIYDYYAILELSEVSNKGFRIKLKQAGYHLYHSFGFKDKSNNGNYRIMSISIY